MLSREKAKRSLVWDELEEAQTANAAITGRISGKVKGGFTVDIKDVRAFLPGSLVDVRPVRDPVYLEGKELEFKIIKLDRKRNNVVVSPPRGGRERVQRRARTAARPVCRKARSSRASSRTSPITARSSTSAASTACCTSPTWPGSACVIRPKWSTSATSSTCACCKFDRERNRVSLGLKQLGEDPWVAIARRYPTGTRMFGKISNVTDYGCFVELEPGVEGLVHVSEMDWTNKNVNPAKMVQVGDEVEVMVLDVDEERRRISLGIKQTQRQSVGSVCRDPQEERQGPGHDQVDHRFRHLRRPGRRHRRPGASVRYFLAEHGRRPRAQLQEGRQRRGSRACGRSGTRAHLARHQAARAGSVRPVHGGASARQHRQRHGQEVDAKGATIDLGEGVEGYLRANDIAKERVEDATLHFKVGDKVEAKYTGMDRKGRVLQLSIRAKDEDDMQSALEEYQSASGGTTKLGALLKEQMNKSE